MATTLADYKAAVTAKGVEAVTTGSALVAAINAARRRVARAHRWTSQETISAGLTTSAGDNSVALTATWRVDAVRISQGSSSWDVVYRRPQELRTLATEDTDRGTPRFWSKHADELILYPIPDGVYTVTVDYVDQAVTPLAADGDVEAALDDTLIDAVASGAMKEMAFRMRDYSAVNFAEAQYQADLLAAIRADNTAQRHMSDQVVRNPRRWADY